MYTPGSFTKNIGWQAQGQTGLQSLHTAIRTAFRTRRSTITREDFRRNCGVVDNDRQLVILNFFLHNTIQQNKNYVTFDQLVRKALSSPHSWNFDQLALFSLHLSEMGTRRGVAGTPEGARFTRDYVRNVLWSHGGWQRNNLNIEAIESSFEESIIARGADTIHKCATNYHFILELCGMANGNDPIINNGHQRWLKDAIYLFFDRVAINGTPDEASLLNLISAYELHKLVGMSKESLSQVAPAIIAAYIDDGGLRRGFNVDSYHDIEPIPVLEPLVLHEAPIIDQGGREESVEGSQVEEFLYVQRRVREIEAQVRNPKNVRELKELYSNRCAFCGKQTVGGISPLSFYSEAAHIQAVGEPHNGPDIKSNMILLCSEHHLQFDRGLHSINISNGGLYVDSKIPDSPINGNSIEIIHPHSLDERFISYHRKLWHYE